VFKTTQCSCCEDNYETGATMAVKKTVSTTTVSKQCFYYEAKIMKQGWKQQCAALTLKTKFHNNEQHWKQQCSQQHTTPILKTKLWNTGDNSTEKNSVHSKHSPLTSEDKIMKHQWQQEVRLTLIIKLWNTCDNNIVFQHSYLKRWSHELLVPAQMLTCKDVIMKHQWPQWLWSCNYEIMVTTINLKLQLWGNLWHVWTAITHFWR
jgi:hypothetical protein